MEQAKVLPFTYPNEKKADEDYNNNYNTRAREDLDVINQTFEDVFGYPMKPFHRNQCHLWLASGIEEGVILLAISTTAGAPMPSWRYTCAIMRNCSAWGIKTIMDWIQNQEEHEARRRELANHHKSW